MLQAALKPPGSRDMPGALSTALYEMTRAVPVPYRPAVVPLRFCQKDGAELMKVSCIALDGSVLCAGLALHCTDIKEDARAPSSSPALSS